MMIEGSVVLSLRVVVASVSMIVHANHETLHCATHSWPYKHSVGVHHAANSLLIHNNLACFCSNCEAVVHPLAQEKKCEEQAATLRKRDAHIAKLEARLVARFNAAGAAQQRRAALGPAQARLALMHGPGLTATVRVIQDNDLPAFAEPTPVL